VVVQGGYGRHREEKKKGNRFIWYRRVVKRGCGILNGVLLVSRKETIKYPHTEIEKRYAWRESKEEQGRSDVKRSPIRSETGDIWRQGGRNNAEGLALSSL
jgi:hypothetical protein